LNELQQQTKQMNKLYATLILGLVILTTTFTIAQEIDESCLPPAKKANKLLLKAREAQGMEALQLLGDAKKIASDNAQVHYEIGLLLMDLGDGQVGSRPDLADKKYKAAIKSFKLAIDYCDQVHADAYFFIGLLYFNMGDNPNAVEYLTKFKKFKNDDVNRFSDDHAAKLNQVKSVLPTLVSAEELKTKLVDFKPFKVPFVSSTNSEVLPMLSPDNELIFYSRRLDRKNLGDLVSKMVFEFTSSRRKDIKTDFDGGKALPIPFNKPEYKDYGGATVSLDNKEMIICACKMEKVSGQMYKNCDLYSTSFEKNPNDDNREDYIWSELVNLGTGINTKNGWEAQPTLSADGNTLYFTAVRPSTQKHDIFISERQADGTWGAAIPFAAVNTVGDDKAPFLHQDSETMYFVSESSQSRPGYGGLDIYYMRQEEDGSWGEPKNIGAPINSADDEVGMIVATDGKLAYYSSNKQSPVHDIFAFELYAEARPKKVLLTRGHLKDDDGEPVKDATIEVAYSGSKKVETFKVNGDDGSYTAVIKIDEEKPEDVMVSVNKKGNAFDSKLIEKEDLVKTIEKKEIITTTNDLDVKKIEVGQAYTINDILYDTRAFNLKDRSKFILDGFARFLKSNPTIKVMIQGHTDNEGDDKKNMVLSDNRAKGVKEYLISQGVKANRLTSKGYGETKPTVENNSDANKAKNRRTDFVITGM
jgi:outer membrane protein OmpA-like peptidoglycan-associated protein